MGRKRTGSCYEKPEGSGRWWYSFLLRSGKRWTKPIPARPDGKPVTEADARGYKDEVLRRYASGTWDPEAPAPAPPPPTPTVAAYATRWAKALTHLSADAERKNIELHVAPSSLGELKLTEVTPRLIAAWIMEVRAKPSPRGGTLAPHTVRGIYQVLFKMFVSAVFEEAVPSNPCQLPRGILPKAADKVPGARLGWRYEREEVVQFISSPEIPQDRRVLYAVLFLAGLRRGEVIVLRWKDWDRVRKPLGCIAVSRGFNSKKRLEKGTKTGAVREVPAHPTLAAILAEWKLGGWERHYGRAPEPEDLIVPTKSLKLRDGTNIYAQLAYDARRLGIRPRRVHGARHTFISLLIDDGARPDLVARLTHTRPVRSAFDVYRNEAWSTLCTEVLRLQIERIPDVLPLWKASGAPEPSSGSATNNATGANSIEGNTMSEGAATHDTRTKTLLGYRGESTENVGISGAVEKEGGPIPGLEGGSGDDSATTGSASPAVGPHTGEAMAYLWVETLLARGEEL